MQSAARLVWCRRALVAIGLVSVLGVFPLSGVMPGMKHAAHGPSIAMQMLMSVYVTLGVFLLIASRKPLEHLSLIWFAMWSSVAHGAVMFVQCFVYPHERADLIPNTIVLFAIALILGVVTPRSRAVTDRSQ